MKKLPIIPFFLLCMLIFSALTRPAQAHLPESTSGLLGLALAVAAPLAGVSITKKALENTPTEYMTNGGLYSLAGVFLTPLLIKSILKLEQKNNVHYQGNINDAYAVSSLVGFASHTLLFLKYMSHDKLNDYCLAAIALHIVGCMGFSGI